MNKSLKTISFLAVFITCLPLAADAYEVVYCGRDGMSLRTGPGTSYDKIGSVHHGAYVSPTGEQVWQCGVLWARVSISGYMKTRGSSRYLTEMHPGHWQVTWWAPGDNFVAMRSSESSRSRLLAKLFTGTTLTGHAHCSSKYLHATADAWVAVRTSSGKVYLR
ncbi:MAG: SH3 domain-containing protein [Verrucomicrobiales bacterium]|nr:SH3 domain-containing protein [Verrucomicrobiales bacterium]